MKNEQFEITEEQSRQIVDILRENSWNHKVDYRGYGDTDWKGFTFADEDGITWRVEEFVRMVPTYSDTPPHMILWRILRLDPYVSRLIHEYELLDLMIRKEQHFD